MDASFLSVRQLSERLGVSRPTLWRWLKAGHFPQPVKFSRGCTRWPASAVDDWAAQAESQNTPKTR